MTKYLIRVNYSWREKATFSRNRNERVKRRRLDNRQMCGSISLTRRGNQYRRNTWNANTFASSAGINRHLSMHTQRTRVCFNVCGVLIAGFRQFYGRRCKWEYEPRGRRLNFSRGGGRRRRPRFSA